MAAVRVEAFIADAVQAVGGKLSALGVGWSTLSAPRFPARHDRVALGVIVRIPPEEARAGHHLSVTLLDPGGSARPLGRRPDGNQLTELDAPFSVPTGDVLEASKKTGELDRVAAQLLAREGDYALVRLPSGEVRRILADCMATIGQVGNVEHSQVKLGRAGRKRLMGRRPHVRGTAMNPRDHPHGGGEGRSPIGLPGPRSPWGKPTLGARTRRRKDTNKYIVRRRYEV